MSEHEERKGARDEDNPPQQEDDGQEGLGTDTGAEISAGTDMPGMMPESRGEVRYPDTEEPDEERPSIAPQEGHVEEDPDTATDASKGAKD